ncbi:hypothetical protein [Clostridium grantii]|uniref:Haemolysin XhlA n=1 Tax=Clostridium grantii DSM 8605 TaxID=1121316 RepID=A0A1M5SBR4_9CLOT|nr:hypothetical protein [Clostridium grantii]SHH35901.1 hypothetical protein SAMN02745207_00853 [Clostridium grantii DSM 8605]
MERDDIVEKLEDHESRIRCTEKETIRQETQIEQLCSSIKDLAQSNRDFIGTIKWGLGLFITILIPVFTYIFSKL